MNSSGTPYRVENLDVYRKSVAVGTRLYQAAGGAAGNGHSAVAGKLRETSLALVLNLAAGLGFWEREWKAAHFAAAKRAVMETPPLLELMVALGELKPEAEARFASELQDLSRMIGGLLRGARRREPGGPEAKPAGGGEPATASCN